MAAAAAQFYFRFYTGWRRCLENVKREQTKFCRNNSIWGWDITTSGLEKQTSVILEFYFGIRFRHCRRYRHFIPHRSTEFYPNWTTLGGYSFHSYYIVTMAVRIFSRFWDTQRQIMEWPRSPVRGHLRSLEMTSFDRSHASWRSIVASIISDRNRDIGRKSRFFSYATYIRCPVRGSQRRSEWGAGGAAAHWAALVMGGK